jgi:hypothetical protein
MFFSIPVTGLPHIPQDVLVHIFSFLDMHSLVAAGLVCWYISSYFCLQLLSKYTIFLVVTLLSSLEGLGIRLQMTTTCGR